MDDQQEEFDPMSMAMVIADRPRRKTGPSGEQTSRFRGVTFNKKSNKFQAVLNNGGSHVHLGTFEQEVDAARAFDRAAIMARGPDKAKTNFPLAEYLDESGQVIEDSGLRAKIDNAADPHRPKRKPPSGITRVPMLALEAGPNSLAGGSRRGVSSQSIEALLALQGGLSGHSGFNGGQGGILEALLSSHALATAGSLEGNFWESVDNIRKKLPRQDSSDATQAVLHPEVLFMIPDPSTRVVGVVFTEGGGQQMACVLDSSAGEVLVVKPISEFGEQTPHEALAVLVNIAGQEKQAAAAAAATASLTATLNQVSAVDGGGVTGADALGDVAHFNTDAAFHALLAAINANGDSALNLEQHLAILSQLGFPTTLMGPAGDNAATEDQGTAPSAEENPSVGVKRKAEEQPEEEASRGVKRENQQEEP